MKTDLFAHPKKDLSASIVVFLVALPLCLGIALASGAPLLSGLVAGVIGGIVVGSLSGSHTSVSGPAAGLAAVVVASITQLKSFEVFLVSVSIAGLFQVAAGFLRAGFISGYIPSNVIKGLLAAIGIILILKQIPHAVGFDVGNEGDFSFLQNDGENTFSELLKAAAYFNPGAVIISAISIPLLVYWNRTPLAKIPFLQSSVCIVLIGVVLNVVFEKYFPFLRLETSHLVNIPPIRDIHSVFSVPDFQSLTNLHVWGVGLTLAIVASLETLINLEATDNLDLHKRVSSPNKELVAQGIGNFFSGLLGGLPITSVVVRSSVNIHSGAHSKLSTLFHGGFLLLSVLFFSSFLNMIPLAALACILIVSGYHLARVGLFKDMYAKGWDQYIPFIGTIVAIVFTDLLTGIVIGSGISIFFLLKSNLEHPFTIEQEKMHIGDTFRILFSNQVSFLSKASIKKTLWSIPHGKKVIIDATHSNFIDHDVIEIIDDFVQTKAKQRNIQTNVLGMPGENQVEDHIEFDNVLNKETQQRLTPAEILELLKKGSERFTSGKRSEKYLNQQVHATSGSQNPMAVILSCIDSRTSPELIFDVGLGDLVTVRIAGNIMSQEILGSIELACKELGAKLVVVLGHSNCGAVGAAINAIKVGNITHITSKIEKAVLQLGHHRDIITADPALVNLVTMNNIKNSIGEIKSGSEYMKEMINAWEIGIVGAFYDTSLGTVVFDELHHHVDI